MSAPRNSGFGPFKTATKIAAIFVAIISVFSFAMDRGDDTEKVVAASEGEVIEAPHQPKRAMTVLAAPGGIAAGALRR